MASALEFAFKLIDQASGPAANVVSGLKGIYDKLTALRGAKAPLDPAGESIGKAGKKASAGAGEIALLTEAYHRLGDAILAVATGVKDAIVDSVGMVISAVDFKDNTKIALDNIIKAKGLSEDAETLFNQAVSFAGATPFDTQVVVSQYNKLLNAGLKPLDVQIALGGMSDISAFSENGQEKLVGLTDAFVKLQGVGRLTNDMLTDAFQSVGRNNIIDALSKDLKKTPAEIEKAMAAGKISAAQGSLAIMEAINTKSGGIGKITAAKAQTFSGLMSTLKSKTFEFLSGVDISPITNAMKGIAGYLDTSTDKGKMLKGALEGLFGGTFAKVGQLLSPENIGKGFMAVIDAVKAIGSTITAVWPFLVSLGGGLWAGVKAAVAPIAKIFGDMFGGGKKSAIDWVAVIGVIGKVLGWFAVGLAVVGVIMAAVGAGMFIVSNAATILAVAVGAVLVGAVAWLIDKGGDLVAWVIGLGVRFYNAGADIVSGLWNGIKSGWATFLSGFKALVAMLPDSVRSVLGIASPSKVFAGIGVNIGEGVEQGVDKSSAGVQTSLTRMVDPSLITSARAGATFNRGGANNAIAINVSGAGDPAAVADRVADALASTLAMYEGMGIEAGTIGATG